MRQEYTRISKFWWLSAVAISQGLCGLWPWVDATIHQQPTIARAVLHTPPGTTSLDDLVTDDSSFLSSGTPQVYS